MKRLLGLLSILLLIQPALAGIAKVQPISQFQVTTGTQNWTSSAFATATTTGNTITVQIAYYSAIPPESISSVTDTAGDTFTQIVSTHDSGGGNRYSVIYAAYNITGNASDAITVHFPDTNASGEFDAVEWSGIKTSAALDQTGTYAEGTGTTSETVTTTGNLAVANELVISVFSMRSSGGTPTLGYPPTNFTGIGQSTNYLPYASAYRILSGGSGATTSATWTTSPATSESSSAIATFEPAAGGGSCTHTGFATNGTISVPNGTTSTYMLANGTTGTPDCSTKSYCNTAGTCAVN